MIDHAYLDPQKSHTLYLQIEQRLVRILQKAINIFKLTCGSHSRVGLIYFPRLQMRVSFKGGPHSRAGLFQGFTVYKKMFIDQFFGQFEKEVIQVVPKGGQLETNEGCQIEQLSEQILPRLYNGKNVCLEMVSFVLLIFFRTFDL